MRTWTAVTPATRMLPADLALLVAPIRLADEPVSIDGSAGHTEGVVLDVEGHVTGFLVRISPTLVATSPRTLVPASAFTVAGTTSLVLAWPTEKLLAQRRLEDDLQHYQAGAAPGEGKGSVNETLKEGIEGSAVGAVVGGILGGIAGGPLLGFALAAFFATGGGLVGFISGGGQATRERAESAKPDGLSVDPHDGTFARLEQRLRDPELASGGLVHVTQFSPLPPATPPPRRERPSAVAH
ncbi:MAG: hypothetical protein ABJE95_16390 [Byssovorax sp.]